MGTAFKALKFQRIVSTFLSVSAALLLVSCSSDVQDQSENATTAAFDVTPISAVKVDAVGIGGNSPWSELPQTKSVTFSACLNDMTLQIPLQNQPVTIESSLQVIHKNTNSNGCFTWDEDFNFAYFAQESLTSYQVKIKGIDGFIGQEAINLQVNPWADSLNKVVYDTRFDELPQTLEASSLLEEHRPFIFKNIKLAFFNSGYDRESNTAYYDFRLNANIEARRLNLQGNPKALGLEKGNFQIELSLIEERAGVHQKLSVSQTESQLTAGQVQENIKFYIARGFQHHPDSRFYLKAKLTPVGLPAQTGAHTLEHHGILPLAGLQGSSEGALEPLENYPMTLVESPLKSEVILAEEENKDDVIAEPVAGENDNFALNIARAAVSPGVLLSNNPTTTTSRIRRMPLEVCLVDGLSQNSSQPLRETKISLTGKQNNIVDTEEARQAVTNVNGCFQSFIFVTYDYLSCEKFYQFDYEVEVLEGRYEGLKTSGSLAINPFNNSDLFYDLNQAVRPPEIACEAPQLAVSKLFYKNDGLVRDGFRLNQNLNLTLQKRYNFEFTPKFYRGSTYQELEGHKNLYHGKFNVKVSVFSPKHSEVNYYDFNENEWDYVTTAQNTMEINTNGVVQGDIAFPFHLSETLFLSFKNLLRVEIQPKDGLNLKPAVFTVPFFALAQGANLTTSLTGSSISEELKLQMEKDLEYNFKVPGHHEQLFTFEKGIVQDGPLDVYRQELIRLGKIHNESFRVISGDYDTFNSLPPLGKSSWDEVGTTIAKEYKTTISRADFRTVTTNYGRVATSVLARFCRLFYQVPSTNQRRTLLFGNSEEEVGAKKIKECLSNPEEHIELIPMSFVEELYGNQQKVMKDGMEFTYITPRFKSDEEGKIRRGNAYFAAYGDRSSTNWGERQSQSLERSLSYGLEGPSMLFVGSSERHSKVEETYKVKNTAEMRAAFNRNYTSRDVIDLTYNSLTLEFTVRKRDCLTLRSKKNVPLAYNFCRKKSRMTRVEETWFFIGDTNLERHGIISDGNFKGDKNRNQVVRGQQNFNLMWDDFEKNDALLVVREIGTITPGDAFDKYISREKGLIPFENRYDHSFPGMMLPFSHRPTSSCNDCQDP